MTTPANLLRDTDAPLIASVCNIPCTGTRTTTTSTISRSHRASSRQINNDRGDDGDWRTEDAEPSGSRGIANGISRGSNGDSNDTTSDDGDLSSSSSSSSPLSSPSHLHPHSILNDEEIARRKRIYSRARLNLLDKLFRDVDMLIYLELGVLYYMDCSLIRFLIRAIIQFIFFTPKTGTLPTSIPRHPFVTAVVASNLWLIFRHIRSPHARTFPNSRGYLQGGMIIDFVGVKGPISRVALVGVDLLVVLCQVILVGIILEKVKIGKELAEKRGVSSSGTGGGRGGEEIVHEGDVIFEIRERRPGTIPSNSEENNTEESGQSHDNEERGELAPGATTTGHSGRRIERGGGNVGPISLRDMLVSEPTPEEQARVEHERSSLIVSSSGPSASHITNANYTNGTHDFHHGRQNIPSSPSTTDPTSSSSTSSPLPLESISSPAPPPPYANPSLHPLDPLTSSTASIMDYFLFPTLRRQWRHSARSSLFIAPELGIPRRSPGESRTGTTTAANGVPGLGIGRFSAWTGLEGRMNGRSIFAYALGRRGANQV